MAGRNGLSDKMAEEWAPRADSKEPRFKALINFSPVNDTAHIRNTGSLIQISHQSHRQSVIPYDLLPHFEKYQDFGIGMKLRSIWTVQCAVAFYDLLTICCLSH